MFDDVVFVDDGDGGGGDNDAPFRVVEWSEDQRREFRERLRGMHEEFEKPVPEDEWRRCMEIPQHLESYDHDTGAWSSPANPEWLRYKKHRFSGSTIAGVVGNGYNNREQSLQNLVWPELNPINPIFTGHGNYHEETCELCLVSMLQEKVDDPEDPLVNFDLWDAGLCVSREHPMLSYSPDGVLDLWYADGSHETILTEYKCPYTKRWGKKRGQRHLYGPIMTPRAYGDQPNPNQASLVPQPFGITTYYYDQIMLGMWLMGSEGVLKVSANKRMRCLFCVWTFGDFDTYEIPFDEGYAENFLVPTALDVWYNQYTPAVVAKQMGMLGEKETTVPFRSR